MQRACQITLSDADRTVLERWSRGRSTQARLVTRARVVLAAAEGKQNKDIAAELKSTRGAVARWRDRFAQSGVAGLEKDAPRGGRPPEARDDLIRRIIEMTTQQKPANATHWSTRTLAEALGTNRSLINRVWRARGLKPHLCHTFKRCRSIRAVDPPTAPPESAPDEPDSRRERRANSDPPGHSPGREVQRAVAWATNTPMLG